MPSGKRAKQQRRVAAPPPVRGKAGVGGARQASPKTLAIAGGVLLLVILAVVLAIVLTQNNSTGGSTDGSYDGPTIHVVKGTPATGDSSNANALPDASGVATMFKGIPQKGFILGNPNAPVTLVEYIDLQCPVCQGFETTELQELLDKYVRPGKLKIEMKLWDIIDSNYPGIVDSLRGQKVTIAAAKQNKAFQFAEVLYNNQPFNGEGTGWMDDAMISNVARSIDGLKTSKFVTDANSEATATLIRQTDTYANNQPQFSGTPTFLLAKGDAAPKYYGTGSPAMDLSNLEPAINALLPKK
ncbi:MAG: hypothetical protein QOG85_183 [Gaiellaceae bacterium]|jgi:protein-disulfide isomerase|nr:hypothetical protein [Gaiellaceae bacterium]